jgi:hypothetical protein
MRPTGVARGPPDRGSRYEVSAEDVHEAEADAEEGWCLQEEGRLEEEGLLTVSKNRVSQAKAQQMGGKGNLTKPAPKKMANGKKSCGKKGY